MNALFPWIVALGLGAPPGLHAAPAPEPFVEDAATQLLARAMVEEARARTKSGNARPTRADLERALARCLDDVDNLLLLSGLMPLAREPRERARPLTARAQSARPRAVISARDLSEPSDGF